MPVYPFAVIGMLQISKELGGLNCFVNGLKAQNNVQIQKFGIYGDTSKRIKQSTFPTSLKRDIKFAAAKSRMLGY